MQFFLCNGLVPLLAHEDPALPCRGRPGRAVAPAEAAAKTNRWVMDRRAGSLAENLICRKFDLAQGVAVVKVLAREPRACAVVFVFQPIDYYL